MWDPVSTVVITGVRSDCMEPHWSSPLTRALRRRTLFSASRAAALGEEVEAEGGLTPGLLAGGAGRTGEVGKEPWPESTEEMLEWRVVAAPSVLAGGRAASCGRRDMERALEGCGAWRRGGGGASRCRTPPGLSSVQEARLCPSGGRTRR